MRVTSTQRGRRRREWAVRGVTGWLSRDGGRRGVGLLCVQGQTYTVARERGEAMKGGGGRVSITLHRLASPSNNSDYRIARRPDPLDSQTRAITAHPNCPHSSTRASGRHQPQSAPEPATATRGHSPTHLSLLRLSLSRCLQPWPPQLPLRRPPVTRCNRRATAQSRSQLRHARPLAKPKSSTSQSTAHPPH